jgi:hypothetical protein
MQNLLDITKRPNPLIMGIEREEVQAKGIANIFDKIIAGHLSNLQKLMDIQL